MFDRSSSTQLRRPPTLMERRDETKMLPALGLGTASNAREYENQGGSELLR